MSQALLDVNPLSFRVCFPGSSHYQIVTTVLDHVAHNTASNRKQILNKLKSEPLRAAVEDEIRAVCREVLASPDWPQVAHQRLTTIHISRNGDASVPTSSGRRQPQSFSLVVTINPEGTADRLWGSVASRLHHYTIVPSSTTVMVPTRRSRRLSIMPEPAAAAAEPAASAPSGRARPTGRGTRTSRLTSPVRRPALSGTAPKPATRRGRGADTSPPAPAASQRTTRTAPATQRNVTTRKKATSPVSTVTSTTMVSRRSVTVRSSRRSVAVSPPVTSRRQTSSRRIKAASPPRKSSLSPAKDKTARATRGIRSPSFAKDIRVRTLRGITGETTDFELPDGLTDSKSMMLVELMANPSVVLETPGVLKRFSRKLKESPPKAKSSSKSPERSTKSSSESSPDTRVTKRRGGASASAAKAGGGRAARSSKDSSPAADNRDSPAKSAAKRGRRSVVEKRARAESRSPSASPPKKVRVPSAGTAPVVSAAAADTPAPGSLIKKRGRPSLASVRKSLNASLTAVPKAASSPASPVLRIHTPRVTATPAAAVRATRTSTELVSQSVAESSEVTTADRSRRRPAAAAPSPALDSPERSAGMKALLAARSSIRRRRSSDQPPPAADTDTPSASPNLKPAREAASAALNRAYVALALSEAKQKDLFLTQVTGMATAASPALVKPVSKKPRADEAPMNTTSKKSTMKSNVDTETISEEPPVKSLSNNVPVDSAPEKTAAGQPDAVDGAEVVFASPTGHGTPRGQLAPRSSVRRAPASALRRVLDREPDSAARSSVRRVLRRPSPPPPAVPDQAAGGDSPLVEAPVTRSRRAKLAAELHPPPVITQGNNDVNNVTSTGRERPLSGVTQLSDGEKMGTEVPQRRGTLRTICLMLLLLIVVVLGVLLMARGQLPAQQQQQLRQLQRSVEQQGQQLVQQLERLVRQQTETVRGWLDRQPAAPPVPSDDQQ